MIRTTLSQFRCFAVAGLSALFLTTTTATVKAATVDQEFWISRTVAAPLTRFFMGTMGNKAVWLRVAPVPGKANTFRGEYSTYGASPVVIRNNFLDGTLRTGTLNLLDTSFDWDKEKVVSKPGFTLRGFNSAFPARLTGTGRDGKTSRPVTLRETAFRFPAGATITTLRIDQSYPKLNYNIALRYPQLRRSGAPLSPALKGFNTEISRMVMASNNEFKKQMKDFSKEDGPSDPNFKRPAGYNAGAFTLDWAAHDLASGELVTDIFYGGAHGVMLHDALTYDFKRNRKLALSDMFVPGSNYLQTLANLCRPALRSYFASNAQNSEINDGTAPKASNYDVWTLSPAGLCITFTDYQVGPYAQGESTVLIPYSSLKSILKPEYAVRLKA